MTRRSLFAAIAGMFGAKVAPTLPVYSIYGKPLHVRTATAARLLAEMQTIAHAQTFLDMPVLVSKYVPRNAVMLFNLKEPK